ncbi:hypothetical protein I3843_12G018900 [Carya illinoinensis]|nr:hypothetical protein I3843_12G018900 [Carya illinoinensis]
MEEDSVSCNVGITQGVGDSSSIPLDVEELGTLPTPSSSTHTQEPTLQPIDHDNPKAQCNYCAKLYSCHYKNGTSSMLHHLQNACETSPLRVKGVGRSQSSSVKRDAEGRVCSPQVLVKYDGEKLRVSTAKYFIRCELPFRLVEHEGFIEYVTDLEPRFTLPSRCTLKRDCIKLYKEEKIQLKKLLDGQRICLTTDTWTSVQNLNYMCITAHFIDCNWRLHKKILKFCQIPDHRGETDRCKTAKTIGRVLNSGLHEWGIDKILTITVNNASSNDVAVDYMRRRIKDHDRTILGGEFLHMRCAAYILNLIVMDGLKDVIDFVSKIRDAIRYVKSSPSRFAKFKACAVKEKISGRMICLDVPTRWNSTYLMLSTAEKHKQAFEQYAFVDDQFLNPTSNDWKNAQIFVELLKVFYDVTLSISGSLYVTANDTLNDMCLSDDIITSTMGINMRNKYEKYWGSTNKFNLMIYVAFVLDPRYKMMAMNFWLQKCRGCELANKIEDRVKLLLGRLIEQYNTFRVASGRSSNVAQGMPSSTNINIGNEPAPVPTKFKIMFTNFLKERCVTEFRSELDRYFSETCIDDSLGFDILDWWRINAVNYPVLAEVARDVLATPISTVASESAFSTGGRILDPFRSSLSPETVEALICIQNWLRTKPINIRDLEEYIQSIDLEDDHLASSSTETDVNLHSHSC